jgi:hypothetical protein
MGYGSTCFNLQSPTTARSACTAHPTPMNSSFLIPRTVAARAAFAKAQRLEKPVSHLLHHTALTPTWLVETMRAGLSVSARGGWRAYMLCSRVETRRFFKPWVQLDSRTCTASPPPRLHLGEHLEVGAEAGLDPAARHDLLHRGGQDGHGHHRVVRVAGHADDAVHFAAA